MALLQHRHSVMHPSFLAPLLPLVHCRCPSTRQIVAPVCSSVRAPDSFSPSRYAPRRQPLMIELASHTISLDEYAPTDHAFTKNESPTLAIVDYPDTSSPNGRLMLEYVQHRLSRSHLYGLHQPQSDLRAILAAALSAYGSPPGFSALLLDTAHDFLHATWVGSCGLVIVRDDAIVYRSYGNRLGRSALEHALKEPCDHPPPRTKSAPTPLTPDSLEAQKRPHRDTVSTSDIHVDYFSLQDNDLVIAGTDGFFSNVSEQQILAFVRPVQDAEDPTLAIANATCLGSWRYDDVHFISYYLAIIAANFSTATNSKPYLPFPFPPSPHLDDVTVACISSSFAL